MPYLCPKDPAHQSTDSDYCSVCGAKITGAPGVIDALNAAGPAPCPIVTAGPQPAGSQVCPDCGTPRRTGARFCEICRFNFETGAPGAIAASNAATASANPAAQPPVTAGAPDSVLPAGEKPPSNDAGTGVGATALAAEAAGERAVLWDIVVVVDPSLYFDPDPAVPCPVNEPERIFPIDLPENLIGRRAPNKSIYPEIPLTDPGVSHRHAKILKLPDGTLALLDVGSTNGTQWNGKDVEAGIQTPLADGDEITLGCWTRLTLRGRRAG